MDLARGPGVHLEPRARTVLRTRGPGVGCGTRVQWTVLEVLVRRPVVVESTGYCTSTSISEIFCFLLYSLFFLSLCPSGNNREYQVLKRRLVS